MRHETLRFLIEKNQKLDETQIRELLNPSPPEWMVYKHQLHAPGDGYKALRIIGTILLFLALGFAIVGLGRGVLFGLYDRDVVGLMTVVPILVMVGIGLFVASRFVTQPPLAGNKDK